MLCMKASFCPTRAKAIFSAKMCLAQAQKRGRSALQELLFGSLSSRSLVSAFALQQQRLGAQPVLTLTGNSEGNERVSCVLSVFASRRVAAIFRVCACFVYTYMHCLSADTVFSTYTTNQTCFNNAQVKKRKKIHFFIITACVSVSYLFANCTSCARITAQISTVR